MTTRRKKKTWIKFYPEKWLFGSTREEMTNAERAVWWDFLALAGLNDPPGEFDFISYRRLANQLNITVKLLKSTIKKALIFGKIELKEIQVGSEFDKKKKKIGSTCNQRDSKNVNLVTTQSEIGLTLRTIKILKWNEYQSEYMRQKPHREKEKEAEGGQQEEDTELQELCPKIVTQVTDRGEERRGEENREEERREKPPTKESSTSPLPSPPTIKDQFLLELKNCRGFPFDAVKDSLLFDITIKDYPGINIVRQVKRKAAWWKDHPEALKANPRKQLQDFFKEESECQKRGGPRKIGEILKGMEDEDQRAWIKRGFLSEPRKE